MNCDHDFVEASLMVCRKCFGTIRGLELEERLAAANTTIQLQSLEIERLKDENAGLILKLTCRSMEKLTEEQLFEWFSGFIKRVEETRP